MISRRRGPTATNPGVLQRTSTGMGITMVQVLSKQDKDAIASLAESFEIDFLSVSYARDGEDIVEARAFLDSLGMQSTKVR